MKFSAAFFQSNNKRKTTTTKNKTLADFFLSPFKLNSDFTRKTEQTNFFSFLKKDIARKAAELANSNK